MRHRRLSLAADAMAVLLGMLIGVCCVMCLRDAFALPAPTGIVLGVCFGAAAMAVLVSHAGRSRLWLLLALAALGGLVTWKWDAFSGSLRAVAGGITGVYAEVYHDLVALDPGDGNPIWVLALAGGLISGCTGWTVAREGSVVTVILTVAPVLVLCLMIVDLAPVVWLVLLAGALLVMLISNGVRERNGEEGSRLAWWLVLPAVSLICVITTLWPPADYTRPSWSETVRNLAESKDAVQNWGEELLSIAPRWNRELQTVDLSRIGPKSMTGTPVLEYWTDGLVSYLRGVCLGTYGDNAWHALDTEDFSVWTGEELQQVGTGAYTLEIKTGTGKPQLYTTYYLAQVPEDGLAIDDAYIRNSNQALQYTIRYGLEQSLMPDGYTAFARNAYLQIPTELEAPLGEFLREHDLLGSTAEEVAAFVRAWGTYDLNTPSIPSDAEFVLYFLQQSRRGYCVHFASSTVMLLRANGIPARYVTGYAVHGAAEQWNQVTSDDAHAWVEYYADGVGWLPLDPTPAEEPGDTPQQTTAETPSSGTADHQEETDTAPEEQQTEPASPEVETEAAEEAHVSAARTGKPGLPIFCLPIGGCILIGLRRWLALRYRREHCGRGNPNRRAMTWWRWLVQLAKVQGEKIPEELVCLAEKACFSQHTLTEEELRLLQQAVEQHIVSLKTASWVRRLWYQYGLVLY